MLRRDPTRIELKADDIEEYELLKKQQQQQQQEKSQPLAPKPKETTAQRIGLKK